LTRAHCGPTNPASLTTPASAADPASTADPSSLTKSSSPMRHSYRSALVTGASSGIGASCARLLAASGCALVLVARREDRLHDLAASLRDQHGADVEVLPADLARDDGLAAVAARLTDGEPVELLVNNAARSARGTFAELTPEIIDAQLRLNVGALTRLAHAAVTGMLARGYGGILNVSSMASLTASPGSAVYGATKAFVTSLTESLHAELAGTDVHVTALLPGFTQTEFHAANNVDISYLPRLAWLDPDAVARAGLDAVAAGRPLAVPGAQYKLAAGTVRLLPRSLLRHLAHRYRHV
jgi:short-subunit dehydrogenase